MAIALPHNFDVQSELLDECETSVRDRLQLTITNWCKFRHVIAVGTESKRLRFKSGVVNLDVCESSKTEIVMATSNAQGLRLPLLYFEQAPRPPSVRLAPIDTVEFSNQDA